MNKIIIITTIISILTMTTIAQAGLIFPDQTIIIKKTTQANNITTLIINNTNTQGYLTYMYSISCEATTCNTTIETYEW